MSYFRIYIDKLAFPSNRFHQSLVFPFSCFESREYHSHIGLSIHQWYLLDNIVLKKHRLGLVVPLSIYVLGKEYFSGYFLLWIGSHGK